MLDQRPTGTQALIYGTVLNVVNEGLLVTVRETNSFGTDRIPNGAQVLLIGNFPGFYDHDKVQATGTPVGLYEYTTVLGSKASTRAFQAASVNKIYDLPDWVKYVVAHSSLWRVEGAEEAGNTCVSISDKGGFTRDTANDFI